ncbi:DUF4998 domain-containing protein [Echinicola shivajiensis]|uniref:DUF4998 domain-containing protein n=1 Tax=Echinicola shivajiensis TaxID=1035916 RepID=UPI001BFCB0FB|nr:DUF4998 domain-containing protein [Echinicola shivajiensis]
MKYLEKIKYTVWVSIFMMLILIWSCETTNETFNEFVLDGETVYVGKADSVIIGEGFNKLRFWVAINADPKISKGILKNNDETFYHEFPVNRGKSGNDTISFDLDIPEGEYTFGLFLLDESGNQSVRVEVPATVYGEKYKSGLINRGIKGIKSFENEAIIQWLSPSQGSLKSIVTYENQEGELVELEVANSDSETLLENYKRGGELWVKGFYRPTDSSIEDFETIPLQSNLPLEYILDKTRITALRLPGDASDGCYGSTYDRLFDGTTGSGFWHSCSSDSDRYPWVMSFDLGSAQEVSKFGIDERPECCGDRSPGDYQIWATNDLTNANTSDIDSGTIEEWEEEAISKGWVKILDVSGNTQKSFEQIIEENSTKYRYVRIVGISSIGGGTEANFNEFTFWGK